MDEYIEKMHPYGWVYHIHSHYTCFLLRWILCDLVGKRAEWVLVIPTIPPPFLPVAFGHSWLWSESTWLNVPTLLITTKLPCRNSARTSKGNIWQSARYTLFYLASFVWSYRKNHGSIEQNVVKYRWIPSLNMTTKKVHLDTQFPFQNLTNIPWKRDSADPLYVIECLFVLS